MLVKFPVIQFDEKTDCPEETTVVLGTPELCENPSLQGKPKKLVTKGKVTHVGHQVRKDQSLQTDL